MKNLNFSFKTRWLLLPLMLLTLSVGSAWGTDYNTTYSYGGSNWTRTNFSDESSYYKSSSSNDCVANIPGIFSNKTITSAVKITLNVACYGDGDNPAATKFKVYNSSACTSQVTATQSGTLPTNSTYKDLIYTVSQTNAGNFTSDLTIKIASGTKLIRLKSIKVEFSYSAAVATPHTVRFYKSSNVYEDKEEISANAGVTPPVLPETCEDWSFLGWSKTASTDEENTDELTLETLTSGKYYPSSDVTLYPVYSMVGTVDNEVSDEITQSTTGLSTSGSTGYTNWSNRKATSNATYSGQSNKGVAFLQLRNNSPSGIITTASGGILKKVVVAWKTTNNPANTDGRYVTVFGKNSEYTGCANLYDNTKYGTSLGTITFGTSTELDNLNKNSEYEYVGILASAAVYINKITITWIVKEDATYYYSYPSCCTPLGTIKGSVSLTQTTATVTWDKLANVGTWAVTYKADGGSESSANVTISDKDASQKQAVITGLIPSTHYTFYVTASNATGYCETSKTWSDVNGTTNAPYTITYKDKGNVNFSGTHASGYPTTHVYGTATTLKGATKTGFDFDGWFTAQDCSGSAITEISASQNANITLYAKWTAHQHTLTWDFNGGGTSSSSYTTGGTKDYGSAITYPADNTMSKVGYTFASWSSSATTMPDADLTITANWNPATNTAYTVKHYKQNLAGDGYDLADTDNLYGTTAANVTPDRKNYEGFTTPGGQLVTILADGTLVVEYQYTRNSYTLTWTTDGDALEGEYTGKSGKVKYGAAITAPNTPTKTNFTFDGWSPAVAATMPAEDTEYTATWIANSHTVTYNANGATSGDVPVDENSPYNHGATAYALDNTGNLQKTHYTFDGWNDGTDDHGVGEDFTVNTDMILYAKWACAEYVNVSKGTPEHGTFSVSTGSKYTCDGAVDVEVTGINPDEGYQFSEVTESGKGTVDGTTVTYAQYASGASTINVIFTAKIIDVTWNLNYEGAPSSAVSKYTYDGSTVSLPAPTRTGYTLAGWFTEETGGSQITNVGGTNKPTGNVEYYAHWNVNNYSVTWMVAGDEWSGKGGQSLVAYGSHVETLPTAPNPKAEPQEGCGDKFMGWTDAADGAYVHGTSNLYTTASQFPVAGTAGQTFYAVFADYVEK